MQLSERLLCLKDLLPGRKELESLTGRKALRLSEGETDGVTAYWVESDFRDYHAVLYRQNEVPRALVLTEALIYEERERIDPGLPATPRLAQAVRSYIIYQAKFWDALLSKDRR